MGEAAIKREGGNARAHARAMAEDAAGRLIGTCMGIANLGDEHEDLFNDSLAYTDRLDELVFECVRCNWWHGVEEIADQDGEWTCQECADE